MPGPKDDEAARKARAAAIRKQVEQFGAGSTEKKPQEPDEGCAEKGPESPREFIQRRMHEIDPD